MKTIHLEKISIPSKWDEVFFNDINDVVIMYKSQDQSIELNFIKKFNALKMLPEFRLIGSSIDEYFLQLELFDEFACSSIYLNYFFNHQVASVRTEVITTHTGDYTFFLAPAVNGILRIEFVEKTLLRLCPANVILDIIDYTRDSGYW